MYMTMIKAQIVVGADDAVDGHEDGEPDEIGMNRHGEDVKLAEETSGDRQTEQREQKEAERSGDPGLALAEPA